MVTDISQEYLLHRGKSKKASQIMSLESHAKLGLHSYMVGAPISNIGVAGVMEGRQPMVRFLPLKPDSLGRFLWNQP